MTEGRRNDGYIFQGNNNENISLIFMGRSPFNEKSLSIYKRIFLKIMPTHTSPHRLLKSCGEHCVYSHTLVKKAASGLQVVVMVDEPQLLR